MTQLVTALQAARDGDFSVRLRAEGTLAEVALAFNALVERNQQVTRELVRVSKVVGREGRITERANVAGAPGSWADQVGAVNELVDNLARPTIEVARVIDAVADGDLSERIQLQIDGQPVRGEFRRIGTTVNGMVDQL
ncbi:MAG: HAMP domain-containing protein, partial [Actinobacteria bacterium]|nr:HAMP domain-containing protein [Actinomycetota bacterium]